MRKKLEALQGQPVEHVGLVYERFGPVDLTTGKLDHEDPRNASWLGRLAQAPIAGDYRFAYQRWLRALSRDGSRAAEVELDVLPVDAPDRKSVV